MARASFGLILANRAVVLGAIQARDLIELSQQAEVSGAFDTLWVGDSLLAKPRLEAVALLAALAGPRRGSSSRSAASPPSCTATRCSSRSSGRAST